MSVCLVGMSIRLTGELLPWQKDYHHECVHVKLEDLEALKLAMPPRTGDNCYPLRKSIVVLQVGDVKMTEAEWEKKVAKWTGKRVVIVATPRRFDGDSCVEGPEHGWALTLDHLSLERVKHPAKLKSRQGNRKR